jgi:hypothetical protein
MSLFGAQYGNINWAPIGFETPFRGLSLPLGVSDRPYFKKMKNKYINIKMLQTKIN